MRVVPRAAGVLARAASSVPLLTALALVASACGTIMQGTTQQMSVSSTPTGARVTVNGLALGNTPLVADLKRKDQHFLRIEMEGYQPHEMALSRSVSGWVVGNIVFGGIIGLAVDAITGGMYKLNPEQVAAVLDQVGPHSLDSDGLVFLVVLAPQEGWELIATLQRP